MFDKGVAHILVETLIAFVVLFLVTRIEGKKQLAQLTFFNYVTGIAVGSIAASMAVDKSISKWEGVASLVAWTLLTLLAEWLSIKFSRLKGPFQSKPSIIIKNGNIDKKVMKKNRLNLEELGMLLRMKDVFSFEDVEIAVMETNGTLSVIKKSVQQTPTRKDLNLNPLPTGLSVPVIVDGRLMEKNLVESGFDAKWLQQKLRPHNVNDYKEVFYAEITPNGQLYVDRMDLA